MSVPGTQGYEESAYAFIKSSQTLSFHEVCKDFFEFLPIAPARVLDVGAGAGQNSAALAEMGYSVLAVEPLETFLSAARCSYSDLQITWLQDSSPLLRHVEEKNEKFDFILAESMWHHLTEDDRNSVDVRVWTSEGVARLTKPARIITIENKKL